VFSDEDMAKKRSININNNNITFIRLYATQAHVLKPYIQIHNTVITGKTTTYTYMSKQTEKTHYMYRQRYKKCTKKKVDYTS